jgi:hypothetical protein
LRRRGLLEEDTFRGELVTISEFASLGREDTYSEARE